MESSACGATKPTLFAQLSKLYAFVVIDKPDYGDLNYSKFYSHKGSNQNGWIISKYNDDVAPAQGKL